MVERCRLDSKIADAETIRRALKNDEKAICLLIKQLEQVTKSICRRVGLEYGIRLSSEEMKDLIQIATINLINKHLPKYKI